MIVTKRELTPEQEHALGVFPTSAERAEIRRINLEEPADDNSDPFGDFIFDDCDYDICGNEACADIWCDGAACVVDAMDEDEWNDLYNDNDNDNDNEDEEEDDDDNADTSNLERSNT